MIFFGAAQHGIAAGGGIVSGKGRRRKQYAPLPRSIPKEKSPRPLLYILETSRFIDFSAHIVCQILITFIAKLMKWEASFPEFAYWCLA